jgi:two-component system, NarL family, invasion response regulator UvrY
MLRDGLQRQIDDMKEFEVVGAVGSGIELLALLKRVDADVVVVDLKLEDMNGFSVLRSLRREFPASKSVVLTMYDHVRYAVDALKAGARGFVVKGAPFADLVTAIRAARLNRPYLSADMKRKMGDWRHGLSEDGSVNALSARELEVLTLIAQGHAMKEVGRRMSVSAKTVSTYRARVLRKLHATTNAELVRIAAEAGLAD